MGRTNAFFVVALCGLGLPGQTEWQEFADADGGFRVLLPGTPTAQTDARGAHVFTLSTGAGLYGVSYADYPAGADWGQTVNAERDATLQGMSGKVLKEKRVSLPGYPGTWVTFQGVLQTATATGPVTGQLRIYFNGHRLYFLMALAPKGSEGQAEFGKFLNSFRVVAKPT